MLGIALLGYASPAVGPAAPLFAVAPDISFTLTMFLTNALKLAAGRLRPDFLDRCQPVDGVCTGYATTIFEGRLSWPSGHSSLSWSVGLSLTCFLWFFLLYLAKTHCRPTSKGHPHLATVVLNTRRAIFIAIHSIPVVVTASLLTTPLLFPAWVGITRTLDNHHFPTDVLSGSLLGAACASLVFWGTLATWRQYDGVVRKTMELVGRGMAVQIKRIEGDIV
ncbi:PAP2 superfamily [Carpediemonas membranifera]|uniref:PAP2 superfamily n=1 Tax=Carpediemonas membranifera TaxID=201153 RepID=A0A8J6AU01_9EUKA|nr:PAP2 superfamily [Carpediemonas membranifera]|eukprot:KAG9394108.1 PAP2 superfamily [Carpediemonas membranifera]